MATAQRIDIGKPVPMPAWGGAAALPLRFLDYLICQPIRAVMLHGAGAPVLIPTPERYAIHKLIVGSRRKDDRDATAKSAKDRLQARSIIEAMIANRQHADLASAFICPPTRKPPPSIQNDSWTRRLH